MPIGGPGKLKKMNFSDLVEKLKRDTKIKIPQKLAGWIQDKYKKNKKQG